MLVLGVAEGTTPEARADGVAEAAAASTLVAQGDAESTRGGWVGRYW